MKYDLGVYVQDTWTIKRLTLNPGVRIERDVDDEIAFHLESRVRELMERGESEEAARRFAEAEFGDLAASRRELEAVDRQRRRRERNAQWADGLAQDFRLAIRSLRRSPGFTGAVVLTNLTGLSATFVGFTSSHDARVRTELLRARTAERTGTTGDLPGGPRPPATGAGVQPPAASRAP